MTGNSLLQFALLLGLLAVLSRPLGGYIGRVLDLEATFLDPVLGPLERGIYRLAHFPQSAEEQLVIYSHWSRNRAGDPKGVYSHQTALSLHELSDVNPVKLHMTVPPTFRRRAKTPKILVLHRASLVAKDVEQRQGFAVTRPLRSIADLAATESVSRDIVAQALSEGRQRGLITAREMSELRGQGQSQEWFDNLLSANQ